MIDTIKALINYLNQYYYGHRKYLLLAVLCGLYLLICEKQIRKKFIIPLSLIVLVVINPILYEKVFVHIVYRRLFWLFSDVILVNLTIVSIIKKYGNKLIKVFMFVISCSLIVILGKYQYIHTDMFNPTVSLEKLPKGVVEVCDYLLSVDQHPKCIMDQQISNYVRQYSADISMLFGRDATGYIMPISAEAKQVYDDLMKGRFAKVLQYANDHNYYFLVTEEDTVIDPLILDAYGFKQTFICGQYIVYEKSNSLTLNYNDWQLCSYSDDSNNMALFYSLYNKKDDYLIIVDGGYEDNSNHVKDIVDACGGDVDAWVITHYHPDHIGAFLTLHDNIDIKNIYDSLMDYDYYLQVAKQWDYVDYYQQYLEITNDMNNVHHLTSGQQLNLDGLQLQVLSCSNEEIQTISNNYPNDASMVFKISGEEDSILFLADVQSKQMSSYLLENYQTLLQSNYVQINHHGWNEFDYEFYDYINPDYAFIDTTYLLKEEHEEIVNLINYLQSKGIEVYDFETAPNRFSFK